MENDGIQRDSLSLEVQCIEPYFLFCVKLKLFCKPDFGESQTIS